MRESQNQSSRFKDAPWFPRNQESVFVGGSGGIGSWLAFFLAKIGFQAIVYDFDTIEEHNLGGQLFRQSDIGSPKVDALNSIINEFCGDNISTSTTPVTINTPHCQFTFSAFDNMKARKDLFEVWKRSVTEWRENQVKVAALQEGEELEKLPIPIYIDGRLEMEQLQIFCVTPEWITEYEKYLFDDSQVADAPCTMKQTSHTAAMIASMMTAFFTNHIANVYSGEVIREVPFYYEFIVPMNLTTTR